MANVYRAAGIAVLAFTLILFGGIYTFANPVPKTDSAVVFVDVGNGHGTGVHIGKGFFLTAGHVVLNADKITLRATDGKDRAAEVLWLNKDYDVALLRADAEGIGAAKLQCRYAQEGEEIKAVGNPVQLKFVASYGHIAGSARELGFWKSVLVTDITTVPGQSGGPVFDKRGNVIGITVGVVSAPLGMLMNLTGFGTIVPSQSICDLMGRSAEGE